MEFVGKFETHFTVRLEENADVKRLREWGAARGLKCTHIILARGHTLSQPMLTRHGSGTLATELNKAHEVRTDLLAAGFEISRIKIEAGLRNSGVPQTDAEAMEQPRTRHFEHHVKLLLKPNADFTQLIEAAQQHSSHMSRNALRVRDDGKQERFVTQRCFGVGKTSAHEKLQALTQTLEACGYEILDIEEEYVVHDSYPETDAGWLGAAT